MSGPCGAGCACSACSGGGAALLSPVVGDPVAYRHGAIKARLLARIAGTALANVVATQVVETRPLERLATREDDDPAIALLDAFAASLHVLAWNTARLYDDGTLPCTEDRDALVDLTRLLGYEPRPAISATTTLAFTLDDLPTSPKVATIPKGMKVASVPPQDGKPQTFETDASIEARAEWNALLPVRVPEDSPVSTTTDTITIRGVTTSARAGDVVLVHLEPTGSSHWLFARIVDVKREPSPEPARTVLRLAPVVGLAGPSSLQGSAFRHRVLVLGQRAAAFGATAPDLRLMSEDVRKTQYPTGSSFPADPLPTEWRNLRIKPATGGRVDLDAVYADALTGRAALFTTLTGAPAPALGAITNVVEGARRDYGLSSKCSRITVTGVDLTPAGFRNQVRITAIHLQTESQEILVLDKDEELPTAAAPDRVLVQGEVRLPAGRRLVLTGQPWGGALGAVASEAAVLLEATIAAGNTTLVFERPLTQRFHSASLKVLANCVAASQGDTPASGAEAIGSGNAATPDPRFPLKAAPLAHVPAPGPRGYAPALTVRVGERLYAEVPSIFGRRSEDRAYMVRVRRGDTAEVQIAGRLPTGTQNVTALYRNGGGLAGNVPAGRITSMLAPVIGVKGVDNPVASEGGSDPETLDDLRLAAPKSIRALDRVVSLADFEAFAEGYRGIGKASATELHAGMRQVVCLTVATTEMRPPVPGSDVVEGLATALAAASAPGRSIRIEGFTDLVPLVVIALAVDPSFRRGPVEAAVRAALAHDFDRRARRFGEALHRSSVLACVQRVEGVVAARLAFFGFIWGPGEVAGRLPCPVPTLVNGVFTPGGLLAVDPSRIFFAEMPA